MAYLEGELLYKGKEGDSAYQIALLNGFIGTEKDWLATLGTSSHFKKESVLHTSTEEQTVFNIPEQYTSNSFIDVYVNGMRLNDNEYTINLDTMIITLTNALDAGAKVEIVVWTMSTNSLPITETINASSTNETAAGTKSVYDYIEERISTLEASIEELKLTIINL